MPYSQLTFATGLNRDANNSKMASNGTAPKVQMPSEADLKSLSEDERLKMAQQASQAASSAMSMVESLKSKAALLTDPKERERVLSEAYDREVDAKGLTKKARILKSGTFQGALGGAGIGVASGMGLGTVLGAVVGTVVSVPTTAVGGLVGAGTGAFHGPWIKFGGEKGKEGENEEKLVQVPQQAIDSGAVQVDDKSGQVKVNDPEALKEAASGRAAEQKSPTGAPSERKKPKKLEIRSNKQAVAGKKEPPTSTEAKTRRKPAKLEVRPKKTQ